MDSATTNINSPSLLTFPPELRNIIYALSLIEAEPVVLAFKEKRHKNPCDSLEPALLFTNTHIRREALPIFYSHNAFHLVDLRAASVFARNLGQIRAPLVKDLRILWVGGKCTPYFAKAARKWVCSAPAVSLRDGLRKEVVWVQVEGRRSTGWRRLIDVKGMLALMEGLMEICA